MLTFRRLKLRNKLLFSLILAWAILLGLTYYGSHLFLLTSFVKLEREQVERNLIRANEALDQISYALATFTTDWAKWKDAYTFVQGKNPAFVANNLMMSAYVNAKVNFLIYFNKQGKIAVGAAIDLDQQKFLPYPAGLFEKYLYPTSKLVQRPNPNQDLRGFITLPSGIMLIAASGLTTGDKNSPVIGSLVTGRYLSTQLIQKIADTTRLNIALLSPNDITSSPTLNEIYQALTMPNAVEQLVKIVNEDTVTGYQLLRDVYNKPIAMLYIAMPRAIYASGKQAVKYYLLAFLVLAILVSALLWWLIRALIIRRLERLNQQIQAISSGNDLHKRVDIDSGDEITSVAKKINQLLSIIEVDHNELEGKVSQRTQALQQANVDLQQEISERKSIEAELVRNKEHLAYLAHHDYLTGLPNRILFNNLLNQEISYAKRHHTILAILFIDLDRFKYINDALGHHVGDEVLKESAKRLTQAMRTEDVVARLGGDEFIILIKKIDKLTQLNAISEKITGIFAQPIYAGNREFFLTVSIGISVYPQDGDSLEDLQKNADTAMYRAKKQGGNTAYYFAKEMNEQAQEMVELEVDLRKAVAQEELKVFYQAKFNLTANKIIGAEALVRWEHPKLGLLPPANFIKLAEETGIILAIGNFVLKQACLDCAAWQLPGQPPLSVAVNLSAVQFRCNDLITQVGNILTETGLPPGCLELEITESAIMHDVAAGIAKLQQLKALGTKIAIDDFGTGYSSMSYLKQFPIDVLKIDQSFIKDMLENNNDLAIVNAIIALAHKLNLIVVAEGVETLEHLNCLVENACDLAQGYYFSRPVPLKEFLLQLTEGHSAQAHNKNKDASACAV